MSKVDYQITGSAVAVFCLATLKFALTPPESLEERKKADIAETGLHAAEFLETAIARTALDDGVQKYLMEQLKHPDKTDELEDEGALCGTPLDIASEQLVFSSDMDVVAHSTYKQFRQNKDFRQILASIESQLHLVESCGKLAVLAYEDSSISEPFIQAVIGTEIWSSNTGGMTFYLDSVLDRKDAERALANRIQDFKVEIEEAQKYKVQLRSYLGMALHL